MTRETNIVPFPVPTGIVDVNGKPYMADAKGALVPVEAIKAQHKLEDGLVRKVMGFALALSAQISRFRGHTFTDLGEFDALLAQEYGLTKGGAKGNRTYSTHDGLFMVEVRVADQIDFGPELQIAKGLVDICLNEWSADAPAELRALVTRAFNVDKEGKINRSEIFMLLRLDFADARWQEAMRAVKDAMRIVGSKSYLRFRMREAFDAAWTTVTIDLAAA
ncbi:MAG: sulfate transporter [Rhodobacteraceae bacterium GWE1_64_9]|nr:MAG: sulfate transporter [Rhodobacteraceae bacterium GWE1_64_9]HBD91790.1 sulfate transporter [Gemmobacter sp.]